MTRESFHMLGYPFPGLADCGSYVSISLYANPCTSTWSSFSNSRVTVGGEPVGHCLSIECGLLLGALSVRLVSEGSLIMPFFEKRL